MPEQSFIQRFFDDVTRNLDDANTSRRYPLNKRLADLHDLDQRIFEDILMASGQESYAGFAESTLTLQHGVEYYRLPEGFRQFLALEYRDTNDNVLARIRSGGFYGLKRRVQVITSARGLRLNPAVLFSDTTSTEYWTLVYQRAPGLLHYASTSDTTAKSLKTGTPPADGGRVVLLDGYYNGMEFTVYDGKGAIQTREVLNSFVDGERMTLQPRHAFDPVPEGEVWYEMRPSVPERYDSIYALDASFLEMGRRKTEPSAELKRQREFLWNAIFKYFTSNVSDRGPERIIPPSSDLNMATEIAY